MFKHQGIEEKEDKAQVFTSEIAPIPPFRLFFSKKISIFNFISSLIQLVHSFNCCTDSVFSGCKDRCHEKLFSIFSFGHPKCHFFVPKIVHLWQKCLFSGAKKWYFGWPKLKTKTTFSCQHPPKMAEKTFVPCVYHFGVDLSQFRNFANFGLFQSRLPSLLAKK